MHLSYETQGFQITEVVPNNEGGYNGFNLQPGDIVLKVNGTLIDNFEGPSLTQTKYVHPKNGHFILVIQKSPLLFLQLRIETALTV